MDKLADLGEALDFWKQRIRSPARKPQQRSVHVNVLDACELRIKTRSQFQQRRDASFMLDITVGWFQRAGNNLQECRLTATVGADDTYSRALLEFKTYVLQGPEFLVPAQAAAGKRLFQSIGGTRVGSVLLRDILYAQDRSHV